MLLRHHCLTGRFDMAVRHVIHMRRMYVYGDNSDQPTLCQVVCNFAFQQFAHKLVTRLSRGIIKH